MGTGGNNPKEAWVKVAYRFAEYINYGLQAYSSECGYKFSAGVDGPEKVPVLKGFNKGEFLVYLEGKPFIVTIKPKDLK